MSKAVSVTRVITPASNKRRADLKFELTVKAAKKAAELEAEKAAATPAEDVVVVEREKLNDALESVKGESVAAQEHAVAKVVAEAAPGVVVAQSHV